MYGQPSRKSDVDLRKRGRPKSKILHNRTVRVRLTDEEYFKLKQLADHDNATLSDTIRFCLQKYYGELKWSGVKFEEYEKT